MFHQTIIQQNTLTPIQDVRMPLVSALDISQVTLSTVYWFTPYLASDFPSVDTQGKKWFFLYSTDHDSGAGGIYWGVGNSIRLNDFQEIGMVLDEYQCETPFLVDYPLETRRLRLYYHTDSTNPLNSGHQETNLITTTGGLLHETTWVQETNPLGSVLGDTHTGYFRSWEKNDGTRCGISFTGGTGFPSPPIYSHHLISLDGLTGTRNLNFDSTLNAPIGFIFAVTFGEFFYYLGRWWWIGQLNSITISNADSKQLAICRAEIDNNGNFKIIEVLQILNNGELSWSWSFKIDKINHIAYCFLNKKSIGVDYTQYNLLQLENYL